MHDSRTVANRFLALAREQGISLTPMQLIKLVYIAHGWMLGLYGRPLIRDPVEAWQYGPVIRRLYNAIRKYGARNVTEDIPVDALDVNLTELEDDLVQQVWKKYGKKNGVMLSRLTHAPGTPWAQTFAAGEFGTPISQDIIADHYQRLAAP